MSDIAVTPHWILSFLHVETTHVLAFGIPHLMSDMSQDRQGDMGICVPKEVLVLDVAISVATFSEYVDIHMNTYRSYKYIDIHMKVFARTSGSRNPKTKLVPGRLLPKAVSPSPVSPASPMRRCEAVLEKPAKCWAFLPHDQQTNIN